MRTAAFVALGLVLAGCGGGGGSPAPTESVQGTPDTGIFGASEFFADPGSRSGEEVSVLGQVGEVRTDNVFTLHGGDPQATVTVIHDYGGRALEAAMVVRVQGTVQPFDAAQVREQLGIALEGEELPSGQPVLVATRIDPNVSEQLTEQ